MEIALAIQNLSDAELAWVAQLGVEQVILGGTRITSELQWDLISL